MQMWKQQQGQNATHTTLIAAFESVNYKEYADHVRRLAAAAANIKISTDDLGDDNCDRSPTDSPMEANESLFLTNMPDDDQNKEEGYLYIAVILINGIILCSLLYRFCAYYRKRCQRH